jgi:hypothetical protein
MISMGEDDSIGNDFTGIMEGVQHRIVLLMRGCHALSMCLMPADRSQPIEREADVGYNDAAHYRVSGRERAIGRNKRTRHVRTC